LRFEDILQEFNVDPVEKKLGPHKQKMVKSHEQNGRHYTPKTSP